jgi:hypothetical protein
VTSKSLPSHWDRLGMREVRNSLCECMDNSMNP